MRTYSSCTAIVAALLTSSAAGAQTFQEAQEFSVERFELPADGGGLIGVEWAEVPKHLEFGFGLWLGGADDPLVLRTTGASGETVRVGSLVQTRVGGSMLASLALFDWIGLTLDVPLVVYQQRAPQIQGVQGDLQALERFGLGAPRLMPKLRLLRQSDHGISVAVLPTVSFPQVQNGHYLGDRGWGFSPSLAVSRAFPYLRLALEGGVRLRQDQAVLNVEVSDEIFARAGFGLTMKDFGLPPLQLDVTVSMATSMRTPFAQDYQDHIELLSGLRYDITPAVTAFAGGGFGIERGFGTPDWRAFGGLRFTGLLERDAEAPARLERPTQIVQLTPCCQRDPEPNPDTELARIFEPQSDLANVQVLEPPPPPLQVREVVFFPYGRSKVSRHFASKLADVARLALEHPELGVVRIIGHTDRKGTRGFNYRLSRRRARAVRRFLLAMGVPRARIQVQYHGESMPMASNRMREGRLLNRRVEVVAVAEDPVPTAEASPSPAPRLRPRPGLIVDGQADAWPPAVVD